MSRWVKALAVNPDNLSLIPGTHMVGTGNSLFLREFFDIHTYAVHGHTYTKDFLS